MAFAIVQCILTCEHSLVFLGVEGAPILYSIGGFLCGLNQIDLMLPPILVRTFLSKRYQNGQARCEYNRGCPPV